MRYDFFFCKRIFDRVVRSLLYMYFAGPERIYYINSQHRKKLISSFSRNAILNYQLKKASDEQIQERERRGENCRQRGRENEYEKGIGAGAREQEG